MSFTWYVIDKILEIENIGERKIAMQNYLSSCFRIVGSAIKTADLSGFAPDDRLKRQEYINRQLALEIGEKIKDMELIEYSIQRDGYHTIHKASVTVLNDI